MFFRTISSRVPTQRAVPLSCRFLVPLGRAPRLPLSLKGPLYRREPLQQTLPRSLHWLLKGSVQGAPGHTLEHLHTPVSHSSPRQVRRREPQRPSPLASKKGGMASRLIYRSIDRWPSGSSKRGILCPLSLSQGGRSRLNGEETERERAPPQPKSLAAETSLVSACAHKVDRPAQGSSRLLTARLFRAG